MGKRKRGTPPPPDENSPADEGGEPKVHVSRDVLADSPDIFARPSSSAEAEPAPEPAGEAVLEPAAETPAIETAAEAEPSTEPEETSMVTTASEPEAASEGGVGTPPIVPAYTAVGVERRWGPNVAVGVVLVVVGLFFLVVRVLDIDLSVYGWPLFVIIPGLTLVVVGFASLGSGALIPGSILTMIGLILAYQNSTGDWPAWAYAWPLVAPFSVGLALYLQGLRTRDVSLLKQGRNLMFIGALIFMILFVLFETILHISGIDYGWFGKAALPALLIVIGVVLLVRSMQRGRSAKS
jgi:hypothetical protein